MTAAAMNVSQFRWMDFLTKNSPVLAGLAALAVPTIYTLAAGIWETPEQGHGPMILAVVLWLFWSKRDAYLAVEKKPALVAAFLVAVPALLAYVLGRSQDILLLEIGAFIPLVIAVLLLDRGWKGVAVYWFVLLFMFFLIPLPGAVIDALTSTLKAQVSHIAEVVLYAAGYPVARSGVLLTVGQYQLLVADACSGMNSMFSLLAVGSLYVYLTRHTNKLRNALLILAIVPMAFFANVIRVMVLILVTYHYGDAAGQGFIHDFAGVVLFSVALVGMFLLDRMLGPILPDREKP
ncbi:exosortase B [Chitinibacteraceae bacterium HSL-7]